MAPCAHGQTWTDFTQWLRTFAVRTLARWRAAAAASGTLSAGFSINASSKLEVTRAATLGAPEHGAHEAASHLCLVDYLQDRPRAARPCKHAHLPHLSTLEHAHPPPPPPFTHNTGRAGKRRPSNHHPSRLNSSSFSLRLQETATRSAIESCRTWILYGTSRRRLKFAGSVIIIAIAIKANKDDIESTFAEFLFIKEKLRRQRFEDATRGPACRQQYDFKMQRNRLKKQA